MVSPKKDLAKLKNKLQNLEKQYIHSEGEYNLGEQLIQLLSEVQAQEILVKNLESKDKKQTQLNKTSELLVKAPWEHPLLAETPGQEVLRDKHSNLKYS
jgi:uncharacterized protein with von Willebrand factor type A (vWA) domain